MKRKITLFAVAAFSIFNLNAQVTLFEDFTAPFNPAANGWDVQNLSSTTGTNTAGWRQGNSASYITALSGSPDDYFAADKYATSLTGNTNTISCWLITPTLNLANGAILQFALKSFTANPGRPERLQIYYSYGTGNNVGNSVGSATNTAGTFTNIIADVNPNMLAGFWGLWANSAYSITGVSTPTVGRIGFRYYIPNGGDGGPNGNYFGMDKVIYQMPCNRPNFYGDILNANAGTTTVCVNASTGLQIYGFGSTAPTTYTWFNGATTSLTAYTFSSAATTEIWSLGQNPAGCVGLDVSYIFVQSTPTVNYLITPTLICSATPFTINASGASTYTYNLGGTSSTTMNPAVLTPPASTIAAAAQFTLTGKSTNGCLSSQVVTINITPGPSVSYSLNPATICSGLPFTITAVGASSYTYNLGTSQVNANPASINTPTVSSLTVAQFTLSGLGLNGCVAKQTITVSINPNPVVTASLSVATACVNGTLTAKASGAATYSWSGAATSTLASFTYSTGTTAGVKQFTVYGISQEGCISDPVVKSVTVSLCTAIEELEGGNNAGVYPNPFSDLLYFRDVEGEVKIYTIAGQLVIEATGSDSQKIETQHLPTGIYILKIKDPLGRQKTFRLIKN